MTTFFGVQLAIESSGQESARRALGQVVRDHRKAGDSLAQRQCWSKASALLVELIPFARLGTWDLIRDSGYATYEEWASGLESMAGWPDADFGRGGRLILVSGIFLVEAASSADVMLGEVCDLPEPTWHQQATYKKLVGAFPMLNFSQVQGSGLYIAPSDAISGFSIDVLRGEGFEYLQDVSS